MARYALQTAVSPEKSRSEIERDLRRYGAEGFAYGVESNQAMIGFRMDGRNVRFLVPIPSADDPQFRPKRQRAGARQRRWEQGVRQRWRALALCIKAKLEAVQAGIVTFDEEFFAHIVLPGGQTVGDRLIPELGKALEGRPLPPLLTVYMEE